MIRMASKAITLIVLVSLLAVGVPLPMPAAAAAATGRGTQHSHHHCCPKPAQAEAAVLPALPSLPCGPNHSCCALRAPAKLPSLPTGTSGKADGQPVHPIQISLFIPDHRLAAIDVTFIRIHSPRDQSTVLRI